MLSDQTRSVILQERERMVANVVKLIGRLSDEVVGSMVAEPSCIKDDNVINVDVVEEKPACVDKVIEEKVAKVIDEKFAHVLQDISYRIGVLKDMVNTAEGLPHRITSQHLNLAHHLLDGYTFTNNSPSAGYVAWTDCHVVYQGTDYTISNSSTSNKYIYWVSATPSSFQTSNTKPSLGANDCLVAVNESGSAVVVLVPGKMRSGAYLMDGTVGTNEIGSSAVTSAKLAASAVGSSHISDGAVVSNKIADGAVVGSKIGAGAVATSKLNLAAHLLY